MIFDIERLIKAADHRDERLRSDFNQRAGDLEEQINQLEADQEKGRKEMLYRAENLVETLRERPVTAYELGGWFRSNRSGKALTGSPVKIRHLRKQVEIIRRKEERECRYGEVQEELRVLLEQGKTQVTQQALQRLGYWNHFDTWLDRYNAAQRGTCPADPED